MRRILLVDDHEDLVDGLESIFRGAGHDAIACASFEVAQQLLRTTAYDVLITDVRLGAFNGLQLALLARDLYPRIRLIVFSGFDDPVLRAEAEQIGAVYMVKPVTGSVLVEVATGP